MSEYVPRKICSYCGAVNHNLNWLCHHCGKKFRDECGTHASDRTSPISPLVANKESPISREDLARLLEIAEDNADDVLQEHVCNYGNYHTDKGVTERNEYRQKQYENDLAFIRKLKEKMK